MYAHDDLNILFHTDNVANNMSVAEEIELVIKEICCIDFYMCILDSFLFC